MVKEIVWTVRATKTYWQIIDYLNEKFGKHAVYDFIHKVDTKIELISSDPYLFGKSKIQKNIFLTTIHKRTTLVYRYRPVKKTFNFLYFGIQDRT